MIESDAVSPKVTAHEETAQTLIPAKIKVARSVKRAVALNDTRQFSSFDDYAGWAVALGQAVSVEDVRTNRQDLWGALLNEWYTQGQLACVFARALARDVSAAEAWTTVVVMGAWTADMVTATVDAAADAGAEVLQLLFACDASVEDALTITTRLAAHARWACADRGWLEGESGDSVQIGLQWISPDRTYESWVLGIAPFETMPFTRRWVGAPFIGLVLRPTPPATERAEAPLGDSGLPSAHLAHVDDMLGADAARRDKWTEGTRRAKRALISPDPLSRARAKVTFAFPALSMIV